MPVIKQLPPIAAGFPVSSELVHKHDESEVLLTSWDSHRPDTFVVCAKWPVQHRFYRAQNGLHDPMLFAESVRQCFPLLSHVGYDVPFGHHLIWQYLNFEIVPSAMDIGSAPTEVELYITCSDVRRRSNGQLAALTLHVIALRDGKHLGVAQTRFSCHTPSVYRRLRGPYAGATARPGTLPPAAAPHLVAREQDADVVLSPTEQHDGWLLRNDTAHPVLFDHPLDHSPGMLMLEAARQATHAHAYAERAYPVRVESTFLQFAEFDAPCQVTVEELPTRDRTQRRLEILATQNGETAFSSLVTALVGPPLP